MPIQKITYRIISWAFVPPVTMSTALAVAVFLSFYAWDERIIWFTLISLISFLIPGVYFLLLHHRHKIDSDVKDMRKREMLYKLHVISSLCAFVVVLFSLEAPLIHRLLLGMAATSVLFMAVLVLWKRELSFHMGMLTILTIFLGYAVSPAFFISGTVSLLLTAVARYGLHMHTLSELVLGFITSLLIYLFVLVF